MRHLGLLRRRFWFRLHDREGFDPAKVLITDAVPGLDLPEIRAQGKSSYLGLALVQIGLVDYQVGEGRIVGDLESIGDAIEVDHVTPIEGDRRGHLGAAYRR